MPKTTTVELLQPIKGHEGMVAAIEIREPNEEEYARHGDPQTVVRNPDGTMFMVEDHRSVKAYIDACIVTKGVDAILLRQLCLADVMKLHAAVLDFFLSARLAISTPPAGPISSSSS